MKTKTTLAALLLAAVMVTPSYGADKYFLEGAEDTAKTKANWATGYFRGYCDAMYQTGKIDFPDGAKFGQLYTVVARYVYYHTEHHHLSETELVKRACKEAWPNLNKHVLVSR